MRQFSIKNEKAATLAVINDLELYQERLLDSPNVEAAVQAIRRKVHAGIGPEHLGKAPSKTEIETELGMP